MPSEPTGSRAADAQQALDPSMVKLTRGTSCVLCQQRKVRCDKNKPCANCVKAGVECKVVPPQPPRRRKKRIQERDLVDRLKKYESMLTEAGVRFDAIGQDLKSDGLQPDDVDDLENDFEGLRTTPEDSASPSTASQRERASRVLSLHKEFRASEQLVYDSSEEEDTEAARRGKMNDSTIHKAFDKLFDDDGFPFVFTGRQKSTAHLHPTTIHIFQLWQTYIDNVNALLKLTHVPSIQGQIVKATSNLEQAPKNVEALMFATYAMAVTSMDEESVMKMFNETKREVLGRFFEALQQALINAGFMRYSDFICLQAYVLFLFAIRWFVDPRQIFCLIGIAVRIAQRMGLHRDPAGIGLAPFEVEQRRRLWWTIVGYDRRIGQMTGSTVTALSSGGDCKLPLNVNDSDLHIDGKELPTPHTGPTEMLFALTRMEIAMAVASNSERDAPKQPVDKSSPGKGQSQVPTIRIAGQDSPAYTLDGYCAHIEGTYLSYCDPKIPLHFFTVTMTRQALSAMRVVNYLMRLHNTDNPLKDIERDNLFLVATQMIEYDNVVHASESLKPFTWYTAHFFPFPAYMFLIHELRQRCIGTMVERTWDAITANYNYRGLHNSLHNPMHGPFSKLYVRAWDARVDALRATGRDIPAEPRFIKVLRERTVVRRSPGSAAPDGVPHEMPQWSRDGSNAGDSAMMTPPSLGGPGTGPNNFNMGNAPAMVESNDMDWSYLLPGFQQEQGMSGPGMGRGFGSQFGGSMGSRNGSLF